MNAQHPMIRSINLPKNVGLLDKDGNPVESIKQTAVTLQLDGRGFTVESVVQNGNGQFLAMVYHTSGGFSIQLSMKGNKITCARASVLRRAIMPKIIPMKTSSPMVALCLVLATLTLMLITYGVLKLPVYLVITGYFIGAVRLLWLDGRHLRAIPVLFVSWGLYYWFG